MDTVTRVDDDLMSRGRIFRREWKRAKRVSPDLCIIPRHFPLHIDPTMVPVVSSQIHFIARAGVGSGPPPAVHMSTVWLLERVYSFVSLVQMDVSRSCGRV